MSAARSSRNRFILLTAALVLALGAGVGTHAQDGGPDAQVATIVGEMDSAEPGEVFALSRGLDRLGTAGVPAAKRALEGASPRAKLGLARFLIAQKERGPAIAALEPLVTGDDAVAGTCAAEMIQQAAKTRDDVKGLRAKLADVRSPFVRIAVAKALRTRAGDVDAERVLKDYLRSDDPAVRAEAALALAEIGNAQAAKAVLEELAGEPTERGKRARAALEKETLIDSARGGAGLDARNQVKLQEKRIEELEAELKALKKKIEAAQAQGGPGNLGGSPLLEELLRNVKLYYVDDGDKLESKALIDAAAKGMIASLDPFSSYMTEKETKDFEDSMSGKYAGIGAVVSMDPKDKILTIIRPIYSGPAYRTGLRSLDKITEVEGESTYGKTVEELVSKLKGLPETKVKIKVYRKGWQKERDFVLAREEIHLDSVHSAMLPGKVGYLSLSQFNQTAEEEVEKALLKLEADGMKGLVFDLRANPGGLLSSAVEISDKFLKDRKLIVYSQGRNEFIAPKREFWTTDAGTHPDYPVIVLVNHASASASEIVSGALKVHRRATLVGENTFGKGSVQQLMKVKATDEKSTLRLTIAKYYLPDNTSIHRDEKTGKGGVDPDIVVESETDPAWVVQETDKLLELQTVEKFVQELWKKDKETITRLADFDNFEPSAYEGFDAFFKSLSTRLDANQVRRLVRLSARRLVQDDRAKEYAFDLEEDAQLQRGIFEVLKKVGEDPAAHQEYAFFGAKFDKAPGAAKKDGGEREPVVR